MVRELVGLLFLLQLAGFHGSARTAPAQPKLVGLRVAIGQTVAICRHDGTPADHSTPDDCCPSCSLCSVPAGVAIRPSDLGVPAPVAFTTLPSLSHIACTAPPHRRVAGASPRGPPDSV